MWQAETGTEADPVVRDVPARRAAGAPVLDGERIRKVRRGLKMSQVQFAEAVGAAGQVTVCRWENNVCRPFHK